MRIVAKYIKQIGLLLVIMILLTPVVALAGKGFYPKDDTIRAGMLVSLTKNSDVVEPASDKNMSLLVGVVGTSTSDYNVEKGQVDVQTDGTVDTLVSTMTGDIHVGDHISPSTLVGVGQKSNGNSWIVGTAQASFNAGTKGAVKTTFSDSSGVKHDIYVATIPVFIKVVQEHAGQSITTQGSKLPPSVQAVANSFANKQATLLAVVLSFLIVLAGLVVAGVIVYSAVKNGISATARQPLAKLPILRRMAQSIIIAIIILLICVLSSLIVIHIF